MDCQGHSLINRLLLLPVCQALELGVIPIMVKPRDDDKNFMNCAVEPLIVLLRIVDNRLCFLHSWVVE